MAEECKDNPTDLARQAFNPLGGGDNARPVLVLQPERYAAHFENSALSDADQKALLEQLWNIMVMFSEAAWNVDNMDKVLAHVFAAGLPDVHNEKEIPNNKNKMEDKNE